MKKKNLIITFIIAIIAVFSLAVLKYTQDSKDEYVKLHKTLLLKEARTLYSNMINVRSWAALHGGVYVKDNGILKPNPYLADNIEYTKNNELLIRVNPAWMTRQVSEISNKKEKYYFRITSLTPINPHNYPDKFEKEALTYLINNKNKDFYTKFSNNKYNFMGTLRVEKACLQCHIKQGLKINDVIGGLRVTLPIDTYEKSIELIESKTDNIYFIIIFTSLSFIALIVFTINSIFKKNKDIRILNSTLERKVQRRTKELRELNKKLLKTAVTDYLTKIPNRRYFFEVGEKTFFLAKREKTNFCMVCLDIDFFKNINDKYGHHAGDIILKKIANILNTHTRESDILARTGGEEFSIVLNNTNIDGALKFAEKIRDAIANTKIIYEDVIIKVTVSAGVSCIKNDDTFQTILNRADSALYLAKENGRNIVICS
ncbi:hypothetical protein CPU12_06035 [Malaciobacter molluscorum LMG 25693]|uniref:diguanylate cyclase n=1 Tax=Malaciobacter molluscorum LMG 25693 TaxID=870501 RepID=A0A2G1DIW7_9BACT|nr:diguanylate cyclase [Malaciobacter molluscorum]AXX91867.1 diguanylate cyclase (DUF3365 domain) [Malaciobacter molluscorum LMG 25693]PHO18276.1 hypothetical protein CPU12_06035 [Malaciobacter molluscorum LMG 25693]